MKCPRCDTDIDDKKKCTNCGLDVAGPQEEIEVEYKDFKTSELLEIRHKKQAVDEPAEIKTVRGHKGERALERESGGGAFRKNARKPVLAVLAVLLLLIAGVFFMFRYFILR